jgi:UDP-glucose 4-epimerase
MVAPGHAPGPVMSRALVTGGAGFLGAAVVRALQAAGAAVDVLGTSSRDDAITPARLAALAPPDLVVHCAGGSSVGASLADPAGDFAKTVPPFAAVLEDVRVRAPGARVVLLSSAAVYGDAAQVPTPETAAAAPLSPYGVHKLMCEQLCSSYGRSFGVASTVVRLFSVYGPGLRKQLLWDACGKARAGELVFAGTGDEQRDWLHVSDAAALIVAAGARATPEVPIVNGASGAGIAVREVVGQICRELGAAPPQFSGAVRRGDPTRYVADISRARALGWSPRVELARGISEFVAWFAEQA